MDIFDSELFQTIGFRQIYIFPIPFVFIVQNCFYSANIMEEHTSRDVQHSHRSTVNIIY